MLFVFLKCWEMCENPSLHLLNSFLWENSGKIFSLTSVFTESGGGRVGGLLGNLEGTMGVGSGRLRTQVELGCFV